MSRKYFFPPITSQAEFENWLSQMDIRIHQFVQQFEQDTHLRLEYKVESMSLIENWLIGRYDTINQAYNPDGIALLDGIGRFVGETFRNYFGGEWLVDLRNPDDLFYQWMGITGFISAEKIFRVIYPHTWVTASLDRRTGQFITQRFEQHFKMKIG